MSGIHSNRNDTYFTFGRMDQTDRASTMQASTGSLGARERGSRTRGVRRSVLAIGVLCSACGGERTTEPSAMWIRLEPTAAVYARGDRVEIAVRSLVTDTIELGPCLTAERLSGGRWTALQRPFNCADLALILRPLSSRTVHYDLTSDMQAGIYRVHLRSAQMNGTALPSEALVSTPILLRE